MRPKEQLKMGQEDLFRSHLNQILNHKHPLYLLANNIAWGVFEHEFGEFYVENFGRPGLPIRLVVGLHYLRSAYGVSDEEVVERFLENPYWQYFCGFEYFEHEFPLDSSSLTRWRKRVGTDGIEKLLKETWETAKRGKLVKESHIKRVNVDTTVQEKAVAFPTDARLYHKIRGVLVREAERAGIELRQNYNRLGKKALRRQGQYSHARQAKRARRETKRLKVYLGRVMRDIKRKCDKPTKKLQHFLSMAERIYNQQRTDTNKVYSVHAPEVECISKGKVHKRYEFGCKAAMATTSRGNWVVGIDVVHGNPYDGHTLKSTIEQVKRIVGKKPSDVYCDKGYRGCSGDVPGTSVHITNKKKKSVSPSEWKWLKRRQAIEPVIGHLKSENKLSRNYLHGKNGDRINAILAGCGFNIRKLLRAFFLFIFKWLVFLYQDRKSKQYSLNLIQYTK